MMRFVRAAAFAAAAAMLAIPVSAEDKKEEPKGERLKTIISATHEFDKDKKLTITAVGQVPTGGWTGAKLTPRPVKEAPKDGIYEFDLTAVRPTGIVTQALSKVKAEYKWDNPPADIKGVKIYGEGEGVKTIKIEK